MMRAAAKQVTAGSKRGVKMTNYLRIFMFTIIVSLVACSSGNKAKNDSDSPNSDTDTQGSGISFLHFFNNFGKFF